MFRWFFAYRFVDTFARDLVDELIGVLPSCGPRSEKTKPVQRHRERSDRAVAFLRDKIAGFNKEQKLNLFQRARLSQRLQNELIGKDYPVGIARQMALEVVTLIG